MEEKEYIFIERESWNRILSTITELSKEISILKSKHPCSKNIYTNKDVREILGVNDKLIRKYRESGILDFSKVGNKYWYTNENIKNFLKNGRE